MNEIGEKSASSCKEQNQGKVISFLQDPRSYPWPVSTVDLRETHGAIVFLAGDQALKIKKAVRFPYMDFSTLEKRKQICRREAEINMQTAPQIYIGVLPITREPSGGLAIDGRGEPVEWAVHMNRFNESNILSSLAAKDGLTGPVIKALADTIAAFHKKAPVERNKDSVRQMSDIADELTTAFRKQPGIFDSKAVEAFAGQIEFRLQQSEHCLRTRTERGLVRRCHGDLHLNNIVVIDSMPVLFDAIEFDEDMATIDILYDLAFLIMDLHNAGFKSYANMLLNRYLYLCRPASCLYGLKGLPLFLACRAGIRAMVAADRAMQLSAGECEPVIDEAKNYFLAALDFLNPPPPRLIAIGGFSGTGKSTLGAKLAPSFGAAPGALHLRSDLERKALCKAKETETLAAKYYTPRVSARVYSYLSKKTSLALSLGHSVIADAVYSTDNERMSIQAQAQALNVPFIGLWLTAPRDRLIARVGARKNDASDATAEIVDRQLGQNTGPISWHAIDASGSYKDTMRLAGNLLITKGFISAI